MRRIVLELEVLRQPVGQHMMLLGALLTDKRFQSATKQLSVASGSGAHQINK